MSVNKFFMNVIITIIRITPSKSILYCPLKKSTMEHFEGFKFSLHFTPSVEVMSASLCMRGSKASVVEAINPLIALSSILLTMEDA